MKRLRTNLFLTTAGILMLIFGVRRLGESVVLDPDNQAGVQ